MAGQWSSLLLLSRGIPDAPWWPSHTTSPGPPRWGPEADDGKVPAGNRGASRGQGDGGATASIGLHREGQQGAPLPLASRLRHCREEPPTPLLRTTPASQRHRGAGNPIAGPLWSLPPETPPPQGRPLYSRRLDDTASGGRRGGRPETQKETTSLCASGQ